MRSTFKLAMLCLNVFNIVVHFKSWVLSCYERLKCDIILEVITGGLHLFLQLMRTHLSSFISNHKPIKTYAICKYIMCLFLLYKGNGGMGRCILWYSGLLIWSRMEIYNTTSEPLQVWTNGISIPVYISYICISLKRGRFYLLARPRWSFLSHLCDSKSEVV